MNHHFNQTLENYLPVKLIEEIKQLRQTSTIEFALFFLPSIEKSKGLQKQFASVLSEIDGNYEGCQRLIKLFSMNSFTDNASYCNLISTNPFLFESLVKANGLMLEFIGESLQRDLTILQHAVQQNKDALRFVPKDLQDKIKQTVQHEIDGLFMQEAKQTYELGVDVSQRIIKQHSWISQHMEKPKDVFQELEELGSDYSHQEIEQYGWISQHWEKQGDVFRELEDFAEENHSKSPII